MKIRAAVFAVAVSALLVSCGGSEEVSVAEESLSAEEIVRRVLDAEPTIESMQKGEERVDEKDGERTEERSLTIRVGGDVYKRVGGEEPPWDEQLTYKGVEYYRDAQGAWRARDETGGFRLEAGGQTYSELERDDPIGWNEALESKVYALDFNQYRDAEVLAERTMDGRQVIGLSAENAIPISLPIEEMESHLFPQGMAIEDPEGLLDKFREEFRAELAKAPDSVRSKQVVWIGVDDHRVYRVETEGVLYRDGVEIGTHALTQTYSLFNEAELPGPLP